MKPLYTELKFKKVGKHTAIWKCSDCGKENSEKDFYHYRCGDLIQCMFCKKESLISTMSIMINADTPNEDMMGTKKDNWKEGVVININEDTWECPKCGGIDKYNKEMIHKCDYIYCKNCGSIKIKQLSNGKIKPSGIVVDLASPIWSCPYCDNRNGYIREDAVCGDILTCKSCEKKLPIIKILKRDYTKWQCPSCLRMSILEVCKLDDPKVFECHHCHSSYFIEDNRIGKPILEIKTIDLMKREKEKLANKIEELIIEFENRFSVRINSLSITSDFFQKDLLENAMFNMKVNINVDI